MTGDVVITWGGSGPVVAIAAAQVRMCGMSEGTSFSTNQRRNLALLEDTLHSVYVSDAERAALVALAEAEPTLVRRIAAVMARARNARAITDDRDPPPKPPARQLA